MHNRPSRRLRFTDVDADPDALLAEVFAAFMEHREPHATARLWFVNGILRALRKDEPLDAALGLSSPGRRTMQARMLLARRNRHLRSAIGAVAVDPALSDWQRCCRLAPLLRRFVCTAWPHAKRLEAPPADWDAWKASLWHAAQCGELPGSARAIYAAVTPEAGFSQQEGHGTLSRYLI